VTTPSVFSKIVVDSSGWIEYFALGPKCNQFGAYIESQTSTLFMPSVVAYEVYKKLLRHGNATIADEFFSKAAALNERLVSFDLDLAVKASKISAQDNLPMADAIIYATARYVEAQLITSDSHFLNLPHVTLL
jgi:toxin FitB